MDYVLTFFAGIVTFVSPCLLPMLPIFISFFSGGETDSETVKKQQGQESANQKRALINSSAFMLGMTVVFVLMGAAAGSFGSFLYRYSTALNIAGGILMVIFGLIYLGVFNLAFFNRTWRFNYQPRSPGFFGAFLFGLVFFISWTPCISPLLGSALLLAANSATSLEGILLLLCFSLGLGLPFIISAMILDTLKQAFLFLKRNQRLINIIAGIALCLLGVLMMTGYLNAFLRLL